MIDFKTFVEARKSKSDYEIYHKSFTSALEEVIKVLEKQGFKMDEDDMKQQVTFGGTSGRARPSTGKTNKFNIKLDKLDGDSIKKYVHFQVYGMKNSFELNMYVD
jgi:hypothetical protein